MALSALGRARSSADYECDRRLTDPAAAASYNNFYEFGIGKSDPAERAHVLSTSQWTIELGGLIRRPRVLALEDLLRNMPTEQRIYRFRCIEGWAMAVPWSGFALKALIDRCEPHSSARYVRFSTAHRPDQMPGVAQQPRYPWPYVEALTMAEANHELTLLACGIYGRPLANQQGAPLRLVVPWKHGYKSIKSIGRIEFLEHQPSTFWTAVQPRDYPFEANVDPLAPHSRWNQSHERLIDTAQLLATQPYNGYGELVSHLYRGSARGPTA